MLLILSVVYNALMCSWQACMTWIMLFCKQENCSDEGPAGEADRGTGGEEMGECEEKNTMSLA